MNHDDDGARCVTCGDWSNDLTCACSPPDPQWRARTTVTLECGHTKSVDATIATWPHYCLTCGVRCAVENCGTPLGAPRDRKGFCAPCADGVEEMERDERRKRVA